MNVGLLLSGGLLGGLWTVLSEHFLVLVLSALVLAIAGVIWEKLVSFLSGAFYPVHVYGRWTTKIMRSGQWADHEAARLYQLGPRVWGHTKTTDDERREYRLSGRITGEKLCMIYKELTHNSLDTGSILLQIGNGGLTMEGYEVGCKLDDKGISSREYKWTSA